MCVCVCVCVCCAFVGLDNKLYKMNFKYIKIHKKIPTTCLSPVANIRQHRATYIDSYFVHDSTSKYITHVLHFDGHIMKTCNRDLEQVCSNESLCVL